MDEQEKYTVRMHGEYRFKVDAQGRVTLPAAFRKVLSSNLVVRLSIDGDCLFVFENQAFTAWVDKLFEERLGGYSQSNAQHVALMREINRAAKDVVVDSADRIQLSADLRKSAGIEKEVVIVGNDTHFEVWDAKRFDDQPKADVSLLQVLS